MCAGGGNQDNIDIRADTPGETLSDCSEATEPCGPPVGTPDPYHDFWSEAAALPWCTLLV